jgi:uncharacterized membrane protein
MSGLAILVPLALTLWVLNAIFGWLDTMIYPFLARFGLDIPGLGVATMITLVILVGALSRNLAGHFVVSRLDAIMSRLPLARSIYTSIKGIIAAFPVGGQGKSFKRVVVVEYPRKGAYSIGFVTNDLKLDHAARKSKTLVSVYFPHPPNPTSGVMVMVPTNEVRELDLSIEEGLKLALSGGIVAPPTLSGKRKIKKRKRTSTKT